MWLIWEDFAGFLHLFVEFKKTPSLQASTTQEEHTNKISSSNGLGRLS